MNSVKTCFARFSLALALALGMVSMPASADSAPPPCPRVVFLGLHGLNEGATGGLPREKFWGRTVDSTWQLFARHYDPSGRPNPAEVQAKSVSYPRLTVSLTKPNVGKIDTSTNQAAAVLKKQIKDFRRQCKAKTAIVLVGYSQGAWVVDRTVRLLGRSKDMTDLLALRSIVGVFLMGDPAWPLTATASGARAGMATWVNRGYWKERDYLNNALSKDEFQSVCLKLSDQRIDPICMGLFNEPIVWIRDLGIHYMYKDTGIPKRGADFLYPLAQRHRT